MSEQELEGLGPIEGAAPGAGQQQEQPGGEPGGGEQQGNQPSEVEALAREMGWAPKTEWRGPEEAWKTASDYIRHGSTIQRELKSRNDAITRDYEARFQRMDRATQIALTRQREQLEAQFEAKKRQAVENMDTGAYDAASRAQSEALKRFDEEAGDVIPRPNGNGNGNGQHSGAPPEVIDFAMANRDWFDVDPVMTGAFVALNKKVSDEHPHLSITDRLTLAKNELMRRFGAQNGNGQANGAAPRQPQVEGGLRPIKSAQKKGWDTLPNEAKTAGAKFVRDGIFKTKEDYANKYWEQE